jgi:hypothetical protein
MTRAKVVILQYMITVLSYVELAVYRLYNWVVEAAFCGVVESSALYSEKPRLPYLMSLYPEEYTEESMPYILRSHCPISWGVIALYPEESLPYILISYCPISWGVIVLYPDKLLSYILRSHCPISWGVIALYPEESFPYILRSHCPISWGVIAQELR